ncbi:DUF7296 family protein [Priestia megaterium]|uniref:DUF7296 family protein n=1 Tax=Priestia megaterium TaxID=1404 RepID=UPI003CC5CE0A
MTKFYNFSQCNSGGYFDDDENVCEEVIIEANNHQHANEIAQKIGIYFNGCSTGKDCSCCGDRWDEVDEDDGKNEPMIYKTPVYKVKRQTFRDKCYVYYLNGTKEVIEFMDKNGKKKKDEVRYTMTTDGTTYNVYDKVADKLIYSGDGKDANVVYDTTTGKITVEEKDKANLNDKEQLALLNQNIEIALLTKDEKWFMELTSQRNELLKKMGEE